MAITRVTTDGITDSAVSTAKIGANAVDTTKIGADVIVADDIADNAVTVAQIQDGAISTAKIANNTITTGHLHTGLSVPDSNIAAMSASKLTGNVATANMPAGAVIKTTRWTSANFNGSTSSTSYVTLDTLSLTATPGNLIYVSGAFPCRGNAGGTWQLAIFQFNDAVSGNVWEGGYHGTNTYESILNAPLAFSYIWAGAATHNVSMHVQSYSGTRYYGTSNQTGSTTTPVITIMEIAV